MRRTLVIGGLVVGFLAIAGLVGVAGWSKRLAGPSVPAMIGTISQNVVAIGRVEPVTEVVLANKIPGRIKAVLVRAGDVVQTGQTLIQFDDEESAAQVRMARARLTSAQAEARRGERAVETARARWLDVKSGARPQEIERARAELEAAHQHARNAEIERVRYKRLFEKGLVSGSQYDAQEAEAKSAAARERAADESLKLLLAGAKPETLQTAWAHVEEATADLTRARNQVAEAEAALERAQAVLRTSVIESSVNGKVIRKMVEPGDAVGIGVPLMVLADVQKVLVKADVDETDLGKIALGQRAKITADAFPGRVFPGTVIEIGESVGKRRIRPDDPAKLQDMKILETKIEVTEGGA
ncbi:MAG TPA: efflux RND transporter periplasmic adaptor subunit, partial [Methylomirabilota bacterium]|nr:efflux RND transporter periplasmic adaptor subunit [Methylomirabilota bacterium]